MKEYRIKIYVRRGGPNYQQGLRDMQECGELIGVPIEVYGPETHLTSIVSYALEEDSKVFKKPKHEFNSNTPLSNVAFEAQGSSHMRKNSSGTNLSSMAPSESMETCAPHLFTKTTLSIVYGMQPSAVQNMLDFDHVCRRQKPSVVAMIYPFSGNHFQKFYWGTDQKTF